MKQRLDRFIHHTATELGVGALIIVSVVLTVLEAAATSTLQEWYGELNLAITLIFVIELSIRWYVARSTRHFFRHYWIDVLAVIPVVRPLRMLRVLRLLRLVRLGVLLSRRTRKLTAALHEGLAENVLIFVILLVLFLIGAIGMTIVEKGSGDFDTLEKSVWFSLFTLMAGEPIGGTAQTFLGKVFSILLMLGGFTLFAMFTGVVSAVMVQRLRGNMEAKEMELEELSGHYVICGWNRAVPVIVKELQSDPQTRDCPIVIVAELEGEPELPKDRINTGLIFFVRGDATSTGTLSRVRVERAAAAILVADKCKSRSDQDRDARTILTALTMEKLKPGIYTSAELLNRENEEHLRMAGVENIVIGDEYMGNIIAHTARAEGLVTVLDDLLTSTHGSEFYSVHVPSDLAGKTFFEAVTHYKQAHGALAVSVVTGARETRHVITNPPCDYVLPPDARLLLIAEAAPVEGEGI